MTIRELRNGITGPLYRYLEGPKVYPSNQLVPESEYPYIYYQFVQSRIPGPVNEAVTLEQDTGVRHRYELATATISFTACSADRDGVYGDDEALDLADRAQGFFLHVGYEILSRSGIVIVDVTNTQNRTAIEIDQTDRRYGFDVLVRYVRHDKRDVAPIEAIPSTIEKEE